LGAFALLELSVYLGKAYLGNDLTNQLGSLADPGVVASLAATLVLILILRIDTEVKRRIENAKSEKFFQLIIAAFAFIGFVVFWLAVRSIGFFVVNQMIHANQPYSTSSIFALISLALTANLCFTFCRTFERSALAGAKERTSNIIQSLLDTAIQAMIIGLIAFAPRYNDSAIIDVIGEAGFVSVFLSFVVAIAVLIFARRRGFQDWS
jgi:hypothetical protein